MQSWRSSYVLVHTPDCVPLNGTQQNLAFVTLCVCSQGTDEEETSLGRHQSMADDRPMIRMRAHRVIDSDDVRRNFELHKLYRWSSLRLSEARGNCR